MSICCVLLFGCNVKAEEGMHPMETGKQSKCLELLEYFLWKKGEFVS